LENAADSLEKVCADLLPQNNEAVFSFLKGLCKDFNERSQIVGIQVSAHQFKLLGDWKTLPPLRRKMLR
jgi:hypothetical protein